MGRGEAGAAALLRVPLADRRVATQTSRSGLRLRPTAKRDEGCPSLKTR
jgi:hypothetical protein